MVLRTLVFPIVTLLITMTGALHAESRFALVVGNSEYQSVSSLDNASNDAALIASTLSGLGFDVHDLIDADREELTRGIAQFGRALRQAGPAKPRKNGANACSGKWPSRSMSACRRRVRGEAATAPVARPGCAGSA